MIKNPLTWTSWLSSFLSTCQRLFSYSLDMCSRSYKTVSLPAHAARSRSVSLFLSLSYHVFLLLLSPHGNSMKNYDFPLYLALSLFLSYLDVTPRVTRCRLKRRIENQSRISDDSPADTEVLRYECQPIASSHNHAASESERCRRAVPFTSEYRAYASVWLTKREKLGVV